MHFHGFVEQEELLDSLAASHICLGVFGTTKQSNYTIQNKVWEGLALGGRSFRAIQPLCARRLCRANTSGWCRARTRRRWRRRS